MYLISTHTLMCLHNILWWIGFIVWVAFIVGIEASILSHKLPNVGGISFYSSIRLVPSIPPKSLKDEHEHMNACLQKEQCKLYPPEWGFKGINGHRRGTRRMHAWKYGLWGVVGSISKWFSFVVSFIFHHDHELPLNFRNVQRLESNGYDGTTRGCTARSLLLKSLNVDCHVIK